jgi:hypothetical protein
MKKLDNFAKHIGNRSLNGNNFPIFLLMVEKERYQVPIPVGPTGIGTWY